MSYSKVKNIINNYGIEIVRLFQYDFPSGLSILDAAVNCGVDNPEDSYLCDEDSVDDYLNQQNWGIEEKEEYLTSYNGWVFFNNNSQSTTGW